jgi:hypothetical protein
VADEHRPAAPRPAREVADDRRPEAAVGIGRVSTLAPSSRRNAVHRADLVDAAGV